MITATILIIVGYTAFSSCLDSIGISSRTLQMITEGDMMNDTGRDEIRILVLRGINKNPISGNGLFGDSVLSGGYAHNFFIEVICHCGYIIGGGLLLWLIYEICNVTFNLKNYHKDVFVAMMCILFLPLMTSGSYLQEPKFFIFIGLLIIMKKKIRTDRILASQIKNNIKVLK